MLYEKVLVLTAYENRMVEFAKDIFSHVTIPRVNET